MQTILDQLIADFYERDLPAGTPRQARLPWLRGKIDAVIGMRRAGKTWFLYQVIRELVQGGVPLENLLYLSRPGNGHCTWTENGPFQATSSPSGGA